MIKIVHYSTLALAGLFTLANEAERSELAKSLGHANSDPEMLAYGVSYAGGNGLANATRGHGVGYTEILRDLAVEYKLPLVVETYDKNYFYGLNISEWDSIAIVTRRQVSADDAHNLTLAFSRKVEKEIATRLFETIYAGLDTKQRAELDKAVSAAAQKSGLKVVGGGAATLVFLNMGGFATYTAMASILHFMSLGTLAFAGYSTVSSILAVALGPVGWAALGSVAAYKLASPSKQKMCAAVVQIAMLRAKYGR